jgi:hypothetical protein
MLHDAQLQPYRQFDMLMEGCCRPYRWPLVNVLVEDWNNNPSVMKKGESRELRYSHHYEGRACASAAWQ